MSKIKNIEAVEDSIKDKLLVENEYGYKHAHGQKIEYNKQQMDYLKDNGLKTEFTYSNGTKVPMKDMCINCQARHILQYRNHTDSKDKPFQVRCNGVPDELPPGSNQLLKQYVTKNNISQERALMLVKSSVDPVAWAEMMFGFNDEDPDWHLRWYQKEQLRCSSPRVVLRQGRRSGKTFLMALKLLYLALTLKVRRGANPETGQEQISGPAIIIVTPFMAQLTNIFDEMEKLLKRSDYLTEQVSSKHSGSLYIKSPFFNMTFANGAKISGFVTGVEIRQDGSSAGSLRGQSANIIYVDEMDMIHEDVLTKVIIPILATAPKTMFFATSTPIGKAGSFYNLCNNRLDFKADYLPTTVLPHWDEFKLELGQVDPNDDAFVSEYMAHFIENATGVFKSSYVYEAMDHYTYEDSYPENAQWWRTHADVRNRSDLLTVIGIDWNKNAGSEFVVVKYDPDNHKWWVVEAKNVSPNQFDSVRFKEEVMALNFKWKPNWIYADEGYGHHIIQDLEYEAQRLQIAINKPVPPKDITPLHHETAKLLYRLKKFNFSQKVELLDPVKGTPFEKTGKEFLVENAIRVFESGLLKFPSNDVVLKTQLLNYVVLRRHASNGKPVYGMRSEKVGDHRLDALMLALGGLFLEKHPLYSKTARLGDGSNVGLVKKETLKARAGDGDQDINDKVPGVYPNILNIDRDGVEDGTGHPIKQEGGRRGNFPRGSVSNAPTSVFEELWNRTNSSNGYDTDNRGMYEKRNGQRKPKGDVSAFVVRRNNRTKGRGRSL